MARDKRTDQQKRQARKQELQEKLAPLKTELEQIEAEEAAEREAAKVVYGKFLKANIDLLLQMLPKHDTLSCDDETPDHNGHRCKRCKLLQIKEQTWSDDWPFDEAEVELEVIIRG